MLSWSLHGAGILKACRRTLCQSGLFRRAELSSARVCSPAPLCAVADGASSMAPPWAPPGGFCRAGLRLLRRLPHGSVTPQPGRPLRAPCTRAAWDRPASARARGGCARDLVLSAALQKSKPAFSRFPALCVFAVGRCSALALKNALLVRVAPPGSHPRRNPSPGSQ